jgi:hypothetical protein
LFTCDTEEFLEIGGNVAEDLLADSLIEWFCNSVIAFAACFAACAQTQFDSSEQNPHCSIGDSKS